MLLTESLEQGAGLYPDKVALVNLGRRYTYKEIESAANSFGNALLDNGFKKQDRTVIYLDNSAESVVAIYGTLKAGGIFVIVDPQVKAKKLEYILQDCGATVLVTDTEHLASINKSLAPLPWLKKIIITDGDKSAGFGGLFDDHRYLSFRAAAKEYFSGPVKSTCINLDLASLVYTSGSSGNPKGVMLSHLNMVSAATSITRYLKNTCDDIIIDTLPLAFDYGLYQVLMAFNIGGTVILEKGFVYPQQIINRIIEEKVTGWPMVPPIAAILVRLKDLGKNDFSGLRYITSTGQVLPPAHIEKLREIFPGVEIYSMYGLTECKRVAYLPPEQLDRRPDSVGKAMPNTEVYLVDDNGEEINEPEREGELVVRGANVMKGYWNLPKETSLALRPGRYPNEMVLHTGDLFKKDEAGYLYFLGRKDDIIKTSGHMVSPREVECVLCSKSDVVEAAVIGVPDEILGKAIKAFVHLADGSDSTEQDIVDYCRERLESFAIPKYICLCGALPTTTSGKIQKRGLAKKTNWEGICSTRIS